MRPTETGPGPAAMPPAAPEASAPRADGRPPPSAARVAAVRAALASDARLRPWEIAVWAGFVAAALLLPRQSLLIAEIAILALFALSLDIVLGFAGIVSLGHAAFFGLGAYVAALFAKHVAPDPLLGLAVAIGACAAAGAVGSVLVMRGSDLTRLMVTLGVALILYELANRLDWLTGGADGLQGVVMGPLLGRFEFDLAGRVACAYAIAVLFVGFLLARRVAHSPFGVSLKALRDNRLRAQAIGLSVPARIAAAYTLGAAMAGAAGALLAQTTGFASLDVLDFHRSADVLLVLVIGGIGWLYGGILGAVAFKLLQDAIAAATPQYWTFWLGLFLVVLVLVGRDRILAPFGGRRAAVQQAAQGAPDGAERAERPR